MSGWARSNRTGGATIWNSQDQNEPVEITTTDIRAAFDRVMLAVEARYGLSISLEKDYYFEVDVANSYSSEVDHGKHILAGQLSEDVEEIAEMLQRDDDETYIWHDLNHLIAVLRYMVFMDDPDNRA